MITNIVENRIDLKRSEGDFEDSLIQLIQIVRGHTCSEKGHETFVLFSPDLSRNATMKEVGQYSLLMGRNMEAMPGEYGTTGIRTLLAQAWGTEIK